ncbi:hypothetical protein MHO82_00920 [Vibrio sp. Of7-15]|uniref:leucine-rich repeat domain-containing protein n=1 Tax=Vibrio sp. Of7-15 TaxID=2724879 RepID=UPI001EF19DA4|nr:leucine-rich repeat domain-containing protein [Vibrio sp. Of7-15]MCG7495421.1 hypothetical protein [Vibrio sp. Of7-15]
MLKKFKLKKVAILLSTLMLAACNGDKDSTDNESTTSNVPVTTVSGQVFKGPLSKANVIALDAQGNEIGNAVTDNEGHYSLSLKENYQGVVRIQASGGEYINEATGLLTALSQPLQAMKQIENINEVVNVTLLTEMAVRDLQLNNAEFNADTVKASNEKVANSMGLSFDIVGIAPLDLLNADNQGKTGAQVDYALLIAGMTQLAHTDSTDISDVISVISSDLSDNGVLDNVEKLNDLHSGINEFIDSDNNKVIVDKDTTSIDEDFYRNTPPTINTLDQKTLFERQQVILAPTISDDKGSLVYLWQQTSGPSAQLSGASTAALSLIPADTNQATELQFTLTVTDQGGLSTQQAYSVLVNPAPIIHGVAFKGPLIGASVIAYQQDGTEIGQSTTSDTGEYQIKNYGLYQGLVTVAVTGGSYISEATGQSENLAQTLRAASEMALQDTAISITPLSELALRRAYALANVLTVENVTQANSEVASVFGLSSLIDVEPINLMDSNNSGMVGTSTDYALALAGALTGMEANGQTLAQWLDSATVDLNDNGQLDEVALLNTLNKGVNDFISSAYNAANIVADNTQLDTLFYRNTPPTIEPIANSNGYEREKVSLSVVASDDGDQLSYQWQQLTGSSASLSYSSSSNSVTVTLPDVTSAEELTFKVTVTDKGGLTDTQVASVSVTPYAEINLDSITDANLKLCISWNLRGATDVGAVSSFSCGYGYPNIANLNGIEQFVNLNHLSLIAQNTLTDLTPLLSLSKLKSFYVRTAVMGDFSILKSLPALETLSLTNNPSLTDFSSLPEFPKLKSIDFYGTGFSDVSILKNIPSLTRLNLGKTSINDVSFVTDLPQLESLQLDHSNLTNISPVSTLKKLTWLSLNYNQIDDITPLRELNTLRTVWLYNNLITDISDLTNLNNLFTVGFSGNPISSISPLSGLTGISNIYMGNTNVSDLSPLSNLNSLSTVLIDSTEVTDLSVFSNKSRLRTVYLRGYKGSDISPFIDLKNSSNSSLTTVYMESAPSVPCSQVTALADLGVQTALTVEVGVTCAAN